MTPIRMIFALCASLFLASCLPVTTSVPVGTTVGFKPDPALSGTWIGHDADPKKARESGSAFFHFLPHGDGSMTIIFVSNEPGKSEGDWSVYKAQPAVLGANHYLNVQEVSNNGQAPDDALAQTFPLLYRTGKDGRVTLYLVDEDLAKAAIQSGKIKGEIEKGDFGDVHITADAAPLDAFFASAQGAALFKQPLLILQRVK